jgi:proteasome activator subunit 4
VSLTHVRLISNAPQPLHDTYPKVSLRQPASIAEKGAEENGSAVEKHAVVLGLKAFIMNTPYDVPAWLPEVLMALTQASNQPAPIKSTVRSASD